MCKSGQGCLTFLKAKTKQNKMQVEKYYFLFTTILWTPKGCGDFISSRCKLSPSASCTLNLVANIEKWKQLEWKRELKAYRCSPLDIILKCYSIKLVQKHCDLHFSKCTTSTSLHVNQDHGQRTNMKSLSIKELL